MNKKAVVFGSAIAKIDSEEYQLAYNIGKNLAKNHIDVVNGGYFGLMEAVSKGAYEENGHITGVTSKIFVEGRSNQYITKEIKTDNYWERVKTLLELGDIFIALKGGTGTLVEVALSIEMLNKNFNEKFIFLHIFWKPIIDHLKSELESFDPRFPKRNAKKYIHIFPDINEFDNLIKEFVK